jgi:hypothetical protein
MAKSRWGRVMPATTSIMKTMTGMARRQVSVIKMNDKNITIPLTHYKN